MSRLTLLALFCLTTACGSFDDDDLHTKESPPASQKTTESAFLIKKDGTLTTGRDYSIIRSDDQSLTKIQAFDFNRVRIYDIYEDYSIAVDGMATIAPIEPPGAQMWRLTLTPLAQYVIDRRNEVSPIPPKQWVHKVIYVETSMGVFWQHGKVTFVKNDGGRRVDEGILREPW